MGGPGSGKGSGGDRGGRKPFGPNKRTLENGELVKRMGSKTPLQLMLEIINDPKTTEERRDRFIVAAAPYLHAKPSTPSVADIIASRFLESSTSLADPSPFADAREALDFLVRRSKASHSGE